jgi:hypothetical protein
MKECKVNSLHSLKSRIIQTQDKIYFFNPFNAQPMKEQGAYLIYRKLNHIKKGMYLGIIKYRVIKK